MKKQRPIGILHLLYHVFHMDAIYTWFKSRGLDPYNRHGDKVISHMHMMPGEMRQGF